MFKIISRCSQPSLICFRENNLVIRTLTRNNVTPAVNNIEQQKPTNKKHIPKITPGRTYLNAVTESKTVTDFSEIEKTALQLDRSMTAKNFGPILMQYCVKNGNYELARDYMQNSNPSLSTISNYLKLCTDSKEIILNYEKIKKLNRGLWDYETGERVVSSLTKTKRWKDCLNIMEGMELGGAVSGGVISHVINAAFLNKEFDLGWDLAYKCKPTQSVFMTFLNHCEVSFSNLCKLFVYFDNYDCYPNDALISEIKTFFGKLGYQGEDCTVVAGNCSNCHSNLKKSSLTPKEFEILKKEFYEKVVLETDIYLNTNPKELRDFEVFLKRNGPFDYVLDGLNVSLVCGRNRAQPETLKIVLDQIKSDRVLVIGRKHMGKWKLRGATFYLIDNSSQDDVFLIWATLCGGMGAKFVSKDLMRNHSFRLMDKGVSQFFKSWRVGAQLGVSIVRGDRVVFEQVREVEPCVQKNNFDAGDNVWHVPYFSQVDSSPYALPDKWMCFRKINNKS